MKNKKRVIALILFFIYLFLFRGVYLKTQDKYTIEFESLDNGIEYQFFYTTASSPSFNETNSVIYTTNGDGENFKSYEVEVPVTEDIVDLRIDFGRNPGVIGIKNFKIIGNNVREISFDEIVNGFNGQVSSYELRDEYLEITSTENDPVSIIKGVGLSANSDGKIFYFLLCILVIVYFILIKFTTFLFNIFNVNGSIF